MSESADAVNEVRIENKIRAADTKATEKICC
jgi:hypothetical protein